MIPHVKFGLRRLINYLPALNLRRKLVLASLSLLVIPVVGFQYIKEMEAFLRADQESALLENSRMIAAALHDYDDIELALKSDSTAGHLFVRPVGLAMNVDGYERDWDIYADRRIKLSGEDLAAYLYVGHHKPYVYALLQVQDKNIVYRSANESGMLPNDHVLIHLQDAAGNRRLYAIAIHSPGRVYARELSINDDKHTIIRLEQRIEAVWQETADGYNVELRIPVSMIGEELLIVVNDVDDSESRVIRASVNSLNTASSDTLGSVSLPDTRLARLLSRLQSDTTRVWVIDNKARVLGLSGGLISEPEEDFFPYADQPQLRLSEILSGLTRILYGILLPQPATEFQDDLANASILKGDEIEQAIKGTPATQWRLTPDSQVNILRACFPILHKNQSVAVVALEKTSNSILILQNKAIEILINLSIVAFFVSVIILLFFATRLSWRVRRLRDEAHQAISHDGRVVGTIKQPGSRDEIGDLSRSYADMLNRLRNYNQYLETMAGKLAHELRTPITVVRSSLENLESDGLATTQRVYTQRAREGVERLNNILSRMSEATRLEQSLQSEEFNPFDIERVVSSCIDGYQLATKSHQFEFTIEKPSPETVLEVNGSADLIAQMLDKLVSNAKDFSDKGAPIQIALRLLESQIEISVSNQGPLLPTAIEHNLFDSMVSERQKKGTEPHLGLGLYIVRLIVEFHRGEVRAQNLSSQIGVEFIVHLPVAEQAVT